VTGPPFDVVAKMQGAIAASRPCVPGVQRVTPGLSHASKVVPGSSVSLEPREQPPVPLMHRLVAVAAVVVGIGQHHGAWAEKVQQLPSGVLLTLVEGRKPVFYEESAGDGPGVDFVPEAESSAGDAVAGIRIGGVIIDHQGLAVEEAQQVPAPSGGEHLVEKRPGPRESSADELVAELRHAGQATGAPQHAEALTPAGPRHRPVVPRGPHPEQYDESIREGEALPGVMPGLRHTTRTAHDRTIQASRSTVASFEPTGSGCTCGHRRDVAQGSTYEAIEGSSGARCAPPFSVNPAVRFLPSVVCRLPSAVRFLPYAVCCLLFAF
jgi:hypothetical protein